MVETIPSTVEVIAERIRSGSQPGAREDAHNVEIIFQGGAMRGVISAGAANYLLAVMGESYPFDESHSTSAGSAVDSYFRDNKPFGASIFYEDLTKKFIGWRNLISKGHFIDIGYLANIFRDGPKSLDFDNLLAHPAESNIYATSVHDAKVINFKIGKESSEAASVLEEKDDVYVYNCQTPEDAHRALIATCHLPFYAGQPVEITKDLWAVDGGISRAARVPLNMAIRSGATHILIVSTEAKNDLAEYKISIEEKIAALAIRKKYPQLAQNYWVGHEVHKDTLGLIERAEKGEIKHPQISVIRAEDEFVPGHTETSPQKLYLAAVAGRLATARAFEGFDLVEDPSVVLTEPFAQIA